MIDWEQFYWYMALGMSLFMLSTMLNNVRMLGSYRMVLEMLDLSNHLDGEDGKWKVRPDERTAKMFCFGVVLISGLLWPFFLTVMLVTLRNRR